MFFYRDSLKTTANIAEMAPLDRLSKLLACQPRCLERFPGAKINQSFYSTAWQRTFGEGGTTYHTRTCLRLLRIENAPHSMKGSWSIKDLDSIKIHWFLRWKIMKCNAKDKHEKLCKNWSMQTEASIFGSCMEIMKHNATKCNSFAQRRWSREHRSHTSVLDSICAGWGGVGVVHLTGFPSSESTCRHYHLTSKTSST